MANGNPRCDPNDAPARGPAALTYRPAEDVVDAVFDILSDARRRHVIRTVGRHESGIHQGALANTMASWGRHELDECEIILHHNLLPKLEDQDLIYRDGSGMVYPTEFCEKVTDAMTAFCDELLPDSARSGP